MKKKFVIYWDNKYSCGPKSQVVEENFFEPDNGFKNEEQYAVQGIGIGETTPMDNNHVWIMRVE